MVGYRFNTIGVSDGISMGTDGMSFSLQVSVAAKSSTSLYHLRVQACEIILCLWKNPFVNQCIVSGLPGCSLEHSI